MVEKTEGKNNESKKERQVALMNKSTRTFTTKSGESFYPDTIKEFDESEAVKLLGYSKEIVNPGSGLKNPKLQDQIKSLTKLVEVKDKELKELNSGTAVKRLSASLEEKAKELIDLTEANSNYADVVKELNDKVKDLEKKLKDAKKR